jgi:glycosyltransferase involved in cell wall biosynthesis
MTGPTTGRTTGRTTGELHFFPDWRGGNPFQQMLFEGLPVVDVTAVPVTDLSEHLARRAATSKPGVLTLHWTSPILARATTDDEADAALAEFVRLLEAFRAAGGRLVWTVHNVVPHDARFGEHEVALARCLAANAEVVHVLNAATADAVAPYYELDPSRVVVIEHSSYLGVYPDRISRARARRRLGLKPGHKALVSLGQLRPYKGLDRLVDAFEVLRTDDRRLRLLVAGHPARGPEMRALVERITETPGTVTRFKRLPDQRLQVWLRAADLAVLPYTDILNSGSFLLAETFGLPVVATRAGGLAAREGEEHVRLFGEGELEPTLRSAVRDLVTDRDGARRARASAEAAAAARPPARMASEFARMIAPLMGRAAVEFTEP